MYSKGKWPLTHAAASDSATGLKNMPLASILKVEIPELHLLGRPPSKKSENEAAVNLGIGRAERAGHLRSCVAGRFFVSLARGIRELPRARAKKTAPLRMFCTCSHALCPELWAETAENAEKHQNPSPAAIASGHSDCSPRRRHWFRGPTPRARTCHQKRDPQAHAHANTHTHTHTHTRTHAHTHTRTHTG